MFRVAGSGFGACVVVVFVLGCGDRLATPLWSTVPVYWIQLPSDKCKLTIHPSTVADRDWLSCVKSAKIIDHGQCKRFAYTFSFIRKQLSNFKQNANANLNRTMRSKSRIEIIVKQYIMHIAVVRTFVYALVNWDWKRKRTHWIVSDPCMKKSMADMIIVDPTMLDATIVTNLTHNRVVTANTIAPPPTATAISRSCENKRNERRKKSNEFANWLRFAQNSAEFFPFVSPDTYTKHMIRKRGNAKCDNRSACDSPGKCTYQHRCDRMCWAQHSTKETSDHS